MKRRDILMGAAALAMAPQVSFAQQAGMIEYVPGLPDERLAAGETVLLDFSASWCGTCRAQGRAIENLRAENAAYDEAITFIRVDWDEFGQSEFAQLLGVPRRSTLILLRGDDELGRIVANTRQGDIQALLDLALS